MPDFTLGPCALAGRQKAVIVADFSSTGSSIAAAMARRPVRIALIDFDGNLSMSHVVGRLESTGAQVIAESCDGREEESIVHAVKRVGDWYGTIDALINCVGRDTVGEVSDGMGVHAAPRYSPRLAMWRLMQACRPYFKRGSHVVNVGAGAEDIALPEDVLDEWRWEGIAIDTVTNDPVRIVHAAGMPDKNDKTADLSTQCVQKVSSSCAACHGSSPWSAAMCPLVRGSMRLAQPLYSASSSR